MDSNQEKFSITWEDLKYLIGHAEACAVTETEFINCLSFKKGLIHNAQCDKCVADYFSSYKVVEESEV